MLRLLFLVLIPGSVTFCSCLHREYHLVNVKKSWSEAQQYCRSNYNDLATVGNYEDMKRLIKQTSASGVTEEVWIGLTKTGPLQWQWSVGETQSSEGVAEYTNWAALPNSSHLCGGVYTNGTWLGADCRTPQWFVCEDGKTPSETYVVVNESKSWREAQQYCRDHHKDLATVTNQAANQALQEAAAGAGQPASWMWLGLFRDQWKWSDHRRSSFRGWEPGQPNNDGVCSLYSPSRKKWYDRGCDGLRPFSCHVELPLIRQQIVRVELESDPSLDLNDPDVAEIILRQLQQRHTGVKLQWRTQQDGKIFHRKEKKGKGEDL